MQKKSQNRGKRIRRLIEPELIVVSSLDGGYEVFGETPKTARGTRALPAGKGVELGLGAWVVLCANVRREGASPFLTVCLERNGRVNVRKFKRR